MAERQLKQAVTYIHIPAAVFAKELVTAYPEAKVILTNRDAHEWHKSVQTTLLNNVYHPWSAVIDTLAILTHSPNRWTRKMFIRAFTDYFHGDFQRNGIQVYHAHYAMVRDMVPAENLLEYHVQDGWGSLCAFLGHDVPKDEEFPNGNHGKETKERIWALVYSEVWRLLGLVGDFGVVVLLLLCL